MFREFFSLAFDLSFCVNHEASMAESEITVKVELSDEFKEAVEEIKRGARNSRSDQERLQMVHDYSVENGAICKGGKALGPDEVVVYLGGEVKALGNGRVGGLLVRHSDETTPDLTDDFFDAKTDIHFSDNLPVLYQHGMDSKMGKRVLGSATAKRDDVGVWLEAQLNLRDEYEKAIYGMVEQKKLGWSSGAIAHLVDRELSSNGKSYHIKSWFIGEASLTPTPAEPRNVVESLKSWKPLEAAWPDNSVKNKQEKSKMENEEIKSMLDANNETILKSLQASVDTAAQKAVDNVLEKLPEVKAKIGAVQVVTDEADQPFKSAGEYFMAVKNAAIMPSAIDPRLKGLKATGLSEAQPSQAGFLVPQQTAAGIIEKMYGVGRVLSLFTNRDRVTGNNMTYNVVDETSRATGSRYGGLQAYWLNEGGTKTASKPKFRQLELKLKKVAALCVATDELLEDAPALESWLTRTVPDELRFMVEDAIINGDGVGKPLGLRNGPIVSAVRTDANKIQAADLGNMWAARWAGVNDYVWLGNQSIFPQLLTLSIGNSPVFLPAGGLSGLPYATLLGRPYYDVEYLPTLGTAGDLLLVSPSQYQMIEKNGIQTASSIHVYFTTDESAFRFVYRVDGAPIWNSTLTGFDAGTYGPTVQLAATT